MNAVKVGARLEGAIMGECARSSAFAVGISRIKLQCSAAES